MRLARTLYTTALLSTFLLPAQSFASIDDELDELLSLDIADLINLKVDVASSKEETIFNSVSTVSVISKKQIETYGFRSIDEAISTLAGVDVLGTYFTKSIPTARGIVQEHYANKVLVMINKVPMQNATNGEPYTSRINIHDVKRIEVLKGPASVLYGTNAYSGAINIVLHDTETAGGQAFAGFGSSNQRTAGASNTFVSKDKEFGLFVSANFERSDEHDFNFTGEDGISGNVNDYFKKRNLTLQARYNTHELLANAFRSDQISLGLIPRISFAAGLPVRAEGYLLGYKYNYDFGNDSTLGYSSNFDWNRRRYSRNAADTARTDFWGYHTNNIIKYNQSLYDNYTFELGLEHDYRHSNEYRNYLVADKTIIGQNNLQDKNVEETSLFSQVGYEKDQWKGVIGARLVDNQLFGENFSSRGTLVYSFSDTSSLKFIAGQSYRSPSLFELYLTPDSQAVFGNPDLEPETSVSYEVSYLKAFGNYFMQANAYHASYDKKIFRTIADVTLADGSVLADKNVYTNGKKFKSYGLELETRYSNGGLDGFFNINFIMGNSGDEEPGTDHYNFKYVPDYTISSGISQKIHDFTLSTVAYYRDSTGGPIEDVDSTFTMDITLGYDQKIKHSNIHHRLRLDNITDEIFNVAEYSRRKGSNEIPINFGRALTYELSFKF